MQKTACDGGPNLVQVEGSLPWQSDTLNITFTVRMLEGVVTCLIWSRHWNCAFGSCVERGLKWIQYTAGRKNGQVLQESYKYGALGYSLLWFSQTIVHLSLISAKLWTRKKVIRMLWAFSFQVVEHLASKALPSHPHLKSISSVLAMSWWRMASGDLPHFNTMKDLCAANF